MRKFIAVSVSALSLFFGCCFAACGEQKPAEEPTPLTMQDCFKDFVSSIYFKFSNKPQGYEDDVFTRQNVSLSELAKAENDMVAGQYSYFLIYTTDNASKIEVTEIKFDVIVTNDCLMQFNLQLSENNTVYSDNSVSAKAGIPTTITFTGLHKRWTSNEAGKSELRADMMIGNASTYLKIEPVGKGMLVENSYSIKNLEIKFTEL